MHDPIRIFKILEAEGKVTHKVFIVQLAVDDDIRHTQRQRTVRAGTDGHPLVGLDPGQRKAWMDRHQLAALRASAAHEGRCAQVTDQVAAGFEQVAAKGQYIIGIIDVIDRQRVHALREPYGHAGGALPQAFTRDHIW